MKHIPGSLEACKAAFVSLINDEDYQKHKPLLRTLQLAIAKDEAVQAGEAGMIEKGSQITAICGSCLDYHKPKQLVDITFDTPHGCRIVIVTHRCPACHKLSKAQYKHFSDGPVTSENGYHVTPGEA